MVEEEESTCIPFPVGGGADRGPNQPLPPLSPAAAPSRFGPICFAMSDRERPMSDREPDSVSDAARDSADDERDSAHGQPSAPGPLIWGGGVERR